VEGLRLLLMLFPQQQFNATEDRRAELRAKEQLALIATRTAIKTTRHTWLRIPDRSSSAIASKPSRYAA
jgi:hypothetical protein